MNRTSVSPDMTKVSSVDMT